MDTVTVESEPKPECRLLSDDEVATALTLLQGWRAFDGKLQHEFVFADFPDAIGFMAQVAAWAERWDHHPDWSNSYKVVRVELWTHDLGGISSLDVALATKMIELASL